MPGPKPPTRSLPKPVYHGQSQKSGRPVVIKNHAAPATPTKRIQRTGVLIDPKQGRGLDGQGIRETGGVFGGTIVERDPITSPGHRTSRDAQRFRGQSPRKVEINLDTAEASSKLVSAMEQGAAELAQSLPPVIAPLVSAPMFLAVGLARVITRNILQGIQYSETKAALAPREKMRGITNTPMTEGLPQLFKGQIYLDLEGNIVKKDLVQDYFISDKSVRINAEWQRGPNQSKANSHPVEVVVDQHGNLLSWDSKVPWFNNKQTSSMRDHFNSSQNQAARRQFQAEHPYWQDMINREGSGPLLVDLHNLTREAFKKLPRGSHSATIRVAVYRRGGVLEADIVNGQRPTNVEGLKSVLDIRLSTNELGSFRFDWQSRTGKVDGEIAGPLNYLKARGRL